MKNYFLLVSVVLICLSSTSCTVLQWRKSDTEIKQTFNELNIATEISYFKVDSLDVNIRVQSVTSAEKNINLVFFHGSPSSLSAWEGYLADSSLREVANMHAIDRPGYGYSNFGDEMTSIQTQAQLMSALIHQKKWNNVIVVGASYGGPLAARIGFLNDQIEAIVMISPAIDPNNEKDIWASRFTQWKLTRWLVPTGYRVAGDEKVIHAQELASIVSDWKHIAIPVLHFHGDIDDIVPYENIYFSKEHFQNIEIISIPEKGHEIAWKNKELIIPHLLKLILQIQKEE
ncbi:alpha/beta hydrolase [uncultured Kordia sp.]|uniref:alpha/beta fold hydrolase n=1 Tax=uncultured Kordia sp. TaxID=507699 RepID=UPI00261A86B9|nr:alpha/beta hydrolase [uncultured Kordia sp.]